MDASLEEHLLNAIELFHYSYKFRESIFALIVSSPDEVMKFLPDLKVLQSSRIRTVVVLPESPTLSHFVQELTLRGHHLRYIPLTPHTETPKRSIRAAMNTGEIPLLSLSSYEITPFIPCSFYRAAISMAHFLGAKKVFFPGEHHGLEIEGIFRSHIAPREIPLIIEQEKTTNLSSAFLAFLSLQQKATAMEFVILEAKAGTLFQEIFSHRGVGTLISDEYISAFRQAQPADTADIALLAKPYIRSGALLPITENDIISALHEYYVYTVNKQIVATAKLHDYGECCEIGKICTLPRYQRQGRARAITEHCIARARGMGKKWVFSLTTQEKMFVFFRQLGFREIPREELPTAWRTKYDLSRPSRAFRLDI